jgi:L-gulono-1,4-lactone dehydrogenase
MTATHGSGLAFGPIAEQIVSLQVIDSEGKMWQVEPENGITDPSRFPKVLEEDPSIPIELMQNDDWFHALLVSMGCMGIVYAVVLQAVDQFWIREQRQVASWRELSKPGGYLQAFLNRPRDPAFPDHLEVTVSPYPRARNSNYHDALLTRRHRLREHPAPTRENRTRGVLGSGDILADPNIRGLAEGVLKGVLEHADRLGLARIHRGSMQALVDKEYVNVGSEVFNLGHVNRFRAFGIEMAFDLKQTIPATERMFEIARDQFDERRHHSVPVSLRFVRAKTVSRDAGRSRHNDDGDRRSGHRERRRGAA